VTLHTLIRRWASEEVSRLTCSCGETFRGKSEKESMRKLRDHVNSKSQRRKFPEPTETPRNVVLGGDPDFFGT